MSLNDTIVACATPAGYASISVIRVSGGQTLALSRSLFLAQPKTETFESHHAYYGCIVDPVTQEIIDTVVATFFRAPHSYTGEDVVEFSCHGNPLIVDRIMTLIMAQGARIAEHGEFTKRALLNGKIDLLQAEAVLDTVYAHCDEARRLAMTQYEGKLSREIYDMRSRIIDLLSLVEAHIDFPEDDDIQGHELNIVSRLQSIIDNAQELIQGARIGLKIKEGYKVLIMGRANVGKSTLFNRIIGYDRAITHETPGTTRDYIEEHIELSGFHFRLFDTAGMLNRTTGVDALALERSLGLLEEADLVLLMFDGSEPMNEEDVYLYNLTDGKNKILIVNKIDLNMNLHDNAILSDSIKLSAKTGENMASLLKGISDNLIPRDVREHALLTRQRHIDAVKRLRDYLVRAEQAPSPETVAFELHAALDVIGELTGKVMRKEILDKIFDEFCIGK